MRKYLAELVGTFTLTLAVGLTLAGSFPVSTPVMAALTLGLFVYTVGHVSGAHLNPAVTLGAWSLGKIGAKDAVMYLVAQSVGAALALLLFSQGLARLEIVWSVERQWGAASAEFIGALFFTFGVASAVYGRVSSGHAGLVVGGSLLLGLALGGSGAVLNPAVAFGNGLFFWAYAAGPIAGAIAGMHLYKFISNEP